MKLKTLTIRGIRGFCEERPVELCQGLTIIYGANGSGKTSIGESLEWLFYGSTSKREKGDALSKTEYAGTYRNIHYAGEGPACVTLTVEFEGADRELRRELLADETSQAYLDGVKCDDFSAVGYAIDRMRPMLLQHSLQDFIHSKPKDRYRAMSSMLGLDELVRLQTTMEQVGEAYRKAKPEHVRQASVGLASFLARAKAFPVLDKALRPLSRGPGDLGKARAALRGLALANVEGTPSDEKLGETLRRARAAKEREVLDWGSFGLKCPSEGEQGTMGETLKRMAQTADGVSGELKLWPEEELGEEADLLLHFYELAQGLRNEHEPDRCPYCRQRSLTAERVAEIDAFLERHELRRRLSRTVGGLTKQLIADAATLAAAEQQEGMRLPGSDAMLVLRRLLPEEIGEALETYAQASEDLRSADETCSSLRERLRLRLTTLGALRSAAEARECGDLPATVRACQESATARWKSLQSYQDAYDAISLEVGERVSSNQDAVLIGLLADLWEGWEDVTVAVADAAVEASLLQLVRDTKSFMVEKQKEILAKRGADIDDWYGLLNPSEPVRFKGIHPGSNAIDLLAESFGESMPAAPNLSCSHLNCVGLAVHLGCVSGAGDGGGGWLLLDDPVQSMDDAHAERFKTEALERLLSRGNQVILLTHLHSLASSAEVRHRGGPDVYLTSIACCEKSGPVLEEKLPRLTQLLQDAEGNMSAPNDSYRQASVACLRRSVERFVKDLYAIETGKPISRRYLNATWSKLSGLLRSCGSFDAADEGKLETVHKFTSEHLHEDDTVPTDVPESSNIQAHVNEMKKLVEKYETVLEGRSS